MAKKTLQRSGSKSERKNPSECGKLKHVFHVTRGASIPTTQRLLLLLLFFRLHSNVMWNVKKYRKRLFNFNPMTLYQYWSVLLIAKSLKLLGSTSLCVPSHLKHFKFWIYLYICVVVVWASTGLRMRHHKWIGFNFAYSSKYTCLFHKSLMQLAPRVHKKKCT